MCRCVHKLDVNLESCVPMTEAVCVVCLCVLREEHPTLALMTHEVVSESVLMCVTVCHCVDRHVDVCISVSICGVSTCVLSLL